MLIQQLIQIKKEEGNQVASFLDEVTVYQKLRRKTAYRDPGNPILQAKCPLLVRAYKKDLFGLYLLSLGREILHFFDVQFPEWEEFYSTLSDKEKRRIQTVEASHRLRRLDILSYDKKTDPKPFCIYQEESPEDYQLLFLTREGDQYTIYQGTVPKDTARLEGAFAPKKCVGEKGRLYLGIYSISGNNQGVIATYQERDTVYQVSFPLSDTLCLATDRVVHKRTLTKKESVQVTMTKSDPNAFGELLLQLVERTLKGVSHNADEIVSNRVDPSCNVDDPSYNADEAVSTKKDRKETL